MSELVLNPPISFISGPMALSLTVDGEIVRECVPQVGFLHRGVEKVLEAQTWVAGIPYMERVDYVSPIHSSLAFALAIEALSKVEVPERASYIRVIACELSRISSHMLNLAMASTAVGAETARAAFIRDREKVLNLFEMIAGGRLLNHYIRIGGVAEDVTDGFIEKTYELVETMVSRLREYADLVLSNSIFRDRLAGIGVLKQQAAIEYGVSGPNLRASGSKVDMRRAFPYSCYHRFEFSSPLGRKEEGELGDAFNRLFVRVLELEQSSSIIKQALDTLPKGQSMSQLPRVFKAAEGEAYIAVESPRGIFGVYVESKGEKYPVRVKIRAPSFSTLHVLDMLLRDSSVADVGVIAASLDLLPSEIDR